MASFVSLVTRTGSRGAAKPRASSTLSWLSNPQVDFAFGATAQVGFARSDVAVVYPVQNQTNFGIIRCKLVEANPPNCATQLDSGVAGVTLASLEPAGSLLLAQTAPGLRGFQGDGNAPVTLGGAPTGALLALAVGDGIGQRATRAGANIADREQRWRGGTALFINYDMPSGVTRKGIWQKFRGRRLIDIDEHRAGRNGFPGAGAFDDDGLQAVAAFEGDDAAVDAIDPLGHVGRRRIDDGDFAGDALQLLGFPRRPAGGAGDDHRQAGIKWPIARRAVGEAASFVAVFLGKA